MDTPASLKPENLVRARVTFKQTNQGGRDGPTPKGKLHCIFDLDGSKFDCRLLFGNDVTIHPGQTAEVAIAFLSPQVVLPKLKSGTTFQLWDIRNFAFGTVL